MRKGYKRIVSVSGFLGSFLVAIGLLANPWLLSHAFGGGTLTVRATILIAAFEVFFIISGLLVFFKGRTPTGRKHLAFGFIAVLLAILIIEGGLHIINAVVSDGDADVHDLSPYEGQEWAEAYFKQFLELPTEYEQYLGWHKREYHSEYINIDSRGVRKTWNPEHHSGEVPSTIYVFGGSTLWGMGARDDYTIPSHLSKLLHDDGYKFTVYNYGEMGYTFTQEIMYLTLFLREGHRPDYVVFYDGINDVLWPYRSGNPGTTYMLSRIRETLRTVWDTPSTASDNIWQALFTLLTRHSMIYRAIGNIGDDASTDKQLAGAASSYTDEELQRLSVGIAENYLRSMELLDRLAEAYDFEYVCFWQPSTCMESKVTDEEAEYAWRRGSPICKLSQMTYDYLVARSPPHFFDITDSFSGRTKTYYIDFAHVSEEANEVVATRIFQVFEDLFLQE